MNREFHTKTFITDPEYPEPGSEIGPDSPSSGDDTKTITEPSPKKSRRGVQKRVVSVPIGDVEGSKSKAETHPPSDSWAWRKYGQKPIKGSPYPRGYYRCSSSKGCPARKQVERSRVDPTTLVITYAGEHNHPVPTKSHHSYAAAAGVGAGALAIDMSPADEVPAKFAPEEELAVFGSQPELELSDDSVALLDQHGQHHRHHWFDDVASTAVLESPICAGSSACVDADVAVLFGEKDDKESLFADLGELPEYSVVFRRRIVKPEEQNRSGSLSAVPCCGSTG